MEPDSRLTCAELLEHKYFDGFRERFEPELQALMSKNQDQHQTKSKKQKVLHIITQSSNIAFLRNSRSLRLNYVLKSHFLSGVRKVT